MASQEDEQRMKLTPGAREKTFGKEPRAVPAALRRWGVGDSQLWIGVVFSLCFLALAVAFDLVNARFRSLPKQEMDK